MKKLLLLIPFLLISCSNDELITSNKLEVTEPVNNLNGVYYSVQNNGMVNLGWFTTYYNYTNTVKRRNEVIATDYFNINNQISIPVQRGFSKDTFYVSQTVNGIQSEFKRIIVKKR